MQKAQASNEAIIQAVRKAERPSGTSPLSWATLEAIEALLPHEPNLLTRLKQMAAHGLLAMTFPFVDYAPEGVSGVQKIVGYDKYNPQFRVLSKS